jgi:hypothetical protein
VRGISRREFLGGAAGVTAIATLPVSFSQSTRTASKRARAATTALNGATVSLAAYGSKTYVDAADTYDGYVGLPLGTTIQKIYMPYDSFPSSPPTKMTQLAAAGCQFIVDVRPSKTLTTTNQNRLSAFLTMLTNQGFTYRVALYAESDNKAFTSAQQWFQYWSYYAPVVKAAGLLCDYDPGCSIFSEANATAYFPSNPTPDELWMDYYATAFRAGERIDSLIALAVAAGIPSGLAEWGWSAGATTFSPMTIPWWNAYCNYLIHLAGQGNMTLGAIYFNSVYQGRRTNVIGSSSDPRIPKILEVVNAV